MQKRRANIRYRKKKAHPVLQHIRNAPLLLLATIAITGTIMYLSAQTNTVTNAFSVGKNRIQIVEEGVNPEAVPWGETTKPVQLRNPNEKDSVKGVVRTMMIPYLTDTNDGSRVGGNLGDIGAPTGTMLTMGDITFHFAADWETNWFYQDGFFYYKKVLKPGENTTKLLEGVTLSSGKESKYLNRRVRIEVLADILQTEAGASGTEWGITVSGDTVSP